MDTAAGSPELLAYPLVARGLTPDSTVIEISALVAHMGKTVG